jgi:hypothetical protein
MIGYIPLLDDFSIWGRRDSSSHDQSVLCRNDNFEREVPLRRIQQKLHLHRVVWKFDSLTFNAVKQSCI